MEQDQFEQLLEGQKEINYKIDKLISLFLPDHLDKDTNPILSIGKAAKFLGICTATLSNACKNNEVPHRRIGLKYIFSKVVLISWLHHLNTSFLDNKINYDNNPANASISSWLRLSENPITGSFQEQYNIKYDTELNESEKLNTKQAAELLDVSLGKLMLFSHGFLNYKFPVERVGKTFQYSRDELIRWMQTDIYIKAKSDYDNTVKKHKEGIIRENARREAERLEKEAKKKQRLEKKLSSKK